MESINTLLYDLALILIVAGCVTILFKALKQPLVLGYIVAGMLTGPYISFIPTATNIESVEFWGKIGVIFLLFGLGLEFSFKKIKKVGGAGSFTVVSECLMMFTMGFLVGKILGWNFITSLFLGGMLSVSSTSIIIKAFDDMGLKNKKFTQLVFGALVIEDLVAIMLLVILPALAISKAFDGIQLLDKALDLSLFLLLWFTGGIFIIPTLYKKLKTYLTNETLIVVSLGLCLGMVVITINAGISEALGAFVMGSILSGTVQNEKIISLTKPIKDFFGAIFFVSVGMLVDPSVVIHYWKPILLITLVVITAKPLASIIGMLFSGQTLKIAMQSGICLCQIGEFSFIIATLGRSLHVTQDYLYPVIVSVSIITTFVTPYWIKLGEPAYNLLYSHAKPQWRNVIERLGTGRTTLNRESEWHQLLKSYFLRLFIYVGWLVLVFFLFTNLLDNIVKDYFGDNLKTKFFLLSGNILCMAPFIYGLLRRKDSQGLFDKIWDDNKFSRGPLLFMMGIKYVLAVFAIAATAAFYVPGSSAAILIISAVIVMIIIASNKLKNYYSRMENHFLLNLNSDGGHKAITLPREMVEEIHSDKLLVNADSFLAGKTISQVHRAKKTGALIIQIIRGGHIHNLPLKTDILYPGDTLCLLGTDSQIQEYKKLAEGVEISELENYIPEMELFQITLGDTSKLLGVAANISDIRNNFDVLIVGLEKYNSNTFIRPTSAIKIESGDTIWVVGSKALVKSLN